MPAFLRYIGHRLYTTWATFWFVLPFVVTYPVQWVLNRTGRRRQLHTLNRAWARFSIFMWGVPVEVMRESTAPRRSLASTSPTTARMLISCSCSRPFPAS